MSDPRFAVPLATNVVVWPRLHAQLRTGLAPPCVLIAAPAGWGKTLLASSWLSVGGEHCAAAGSRWADRGRPARLLGVDRRGARPPRSGTALLEPDETPSPVTWRRRPDRVATAVNGTPVVLVLDNLQTKSEPSFEDTITKLRKTLIVAGLHPFPRSARSCLLHDYAWPVPQPPRSCETRVSARCGSFLPRLVEDSERDPGGRARPRGGEGQAAAAVPARQPLVKDQQPTCAARLGGDERHGDIDRLVTLAVGPLIADRAGVARS